VSLPVMQLKCGTSGNAVPTMLFKCGTAGNAVPTLLRACPPPASTNPCDYDTILATVSGLSLLSCDDGFWCDDYPNCYFLQNLSLYSMPVTLPKTGTTCCFDGVIGTVDVYTFSQLDGGPCEITTYVDTLPVVLMAYCWLGNAVNVIYFLGLTRYGVADPVVWSDGGVNGWTDPPNPNFGTFTRASGQLTTGGTVTLEAP
jgi:hypothetical protein